MFPSLYIKLKQSATGSMTSVGGEASRKDVCHASESDGTSPGMRGWRVTTLLG